MSIQDIYKSLQNSYKNMDPKASDLFTSMSYYAVAGKIADFLLLSNSIGFYGGAVYGACSYVVNVPLESFFHSTAHEFYNLLEIEKPTLENAERVAVLIGTYALTKLVASTATLTLTSFANVHLSFIGALTISAMPFIAIPLIVLPIVTVTALVTLPILFPGIKQRDILGLLSAITLLALSILDPNVRTSIKHLFNRATVELIPSSTLIVTTSIPLDTRKDSLSTTKKTLNIGLISTVTTKPHTLTDKRFFNAINRLKQELTVLNPNKSSKDLPPNPRVTEL